MAQRHQNQQHMYTLYQQYLDTRTTIERSLKEEPMDDTEVEQPVMPFDTPFLQGATLPPHSSTIATPTAQRVMSVVIPTLFDIDPLIDNANGTFMSVADIKSMIQQYEYDKMSNALAQLLQEHVQHGCNKLRAKLPLYHADITLFEKYMDQYIQWAEKRLVERVAVRNAGKMKVLHLEYKFTTPDLPPFGNKNWSTKHFSSIFYDYTEHQHVPKTEVGSNIKTEPGTNVKIEAEKNMDQHGRPTIVDVDWQHVSTGVHYVVFFIDLSTGLVSCNLKLKTMKMVESNGMVTLDGMNEIGEGWIDAH